MKLIHLSDLHLGKRLNEFSLLEDQAYILDQILDLVREEAPQAVLIAGDVYDRPLPGAEAVELCDDFLVKLAGLCPHLFLVSGNHDSPERLAFGGRLMEKSARWGSQLPHTRCAVRSRARGNASACTPRPPLQWCGSTLAFSQSGFVHCELQRVKACALRA